MISDLPVLLVMLFCLKMKRQTRLLLLGHFVAFANLRRTAQNGLFLVLKTVVQLGKDEAKLKPPTLSQDI